MGCEELRALLDAYIDGELSKEQAEEVMAHVNACEACREEFEAAKLLKDCLKDMDEEIAVPLEAQAAWRRAVRNEAKQRSIRKWSRFAAVAAAALVLVIGVGFFMNGEAPVAQNPLPLVLSAAETELIAADGAGEAAVMSVRSVDAGQGGEYTARRKFAAQDVRKAASMVEMLAAEYSAQCSCEDTGSTLLCRVELPCDYMEDFLSAVSGIGTELDSQTLAVQGETAVVLIQIDPI